MVTSRSVAALVPATLLALTAFLASSCDWLSGDIFPSWLPYVEARADLAATATEAGIGPLRSLDTVEFVNFIDPADDVDKSKILAYLKGLNGEALVAFEPAGMAASENWARIPGSIPLYNGLGSRIIQTPTGFIAGQLSFSMDDLTADPVPWAGGIPMDSIVLAMGSPVNYYVIRAGYDTTVMDNQFKIQVYDNAFALEITEVRSIDLPDTTKYLVDAQYYGNADLSAGMFRILVRTETAVYAFSLKSDASFIIAAGDPESMGPMPMSESRAWLTADGVVTMNRSSETYLARYAYDWTVAKTTPTDLLQITGDTEAYQIMSFDPSGSWWYLYDQLTQHLYALRTWW